MKTITIFILIGILVLSCSDNDNQYDQIIGNWKLIKVEAYVIRGDQSFSKDSTDYTDKNIIYNFRSDRTLIVSGGENPGYPNGEYKYFFGKEEHFLDSKALLVKIDDSKYVYSLTNGKMTLGQSYVDGLDLVFEKK